MPIFEFVCEDCGKKFEELVRNVETAETVVCPDCQGGRVRRLLSKVGIRLSSGGGSLSSWSQGSSSASCNSGNV
jgi:putative FmdB family regulatory protein